MALIRSYLPEGLNNKIMFYVGKTRCFLQSYIDTTFSANQITDKILVGDLASASNKTIMKEQGITHIISVMNGVYEQFPDDFKYKLIHVNDDPWVDIGKYFDETNEYIDTILADPNNKILIHCQKGISRSVTLLLAYKIKKMNDENKIGQDKMDEAIKTVLDDVKSRRIIADPNEGFIISLKKYICKINNYDYI